MSERLNAIFKLIVEIKEKHGKQDAAGKLPCPICKGTIHYTVSGFNGHTHGTCADSSCIQWSE